MSDHWAVCLKPVPRTESEDIEGLDEFWVYGNQLVYVGTALGCTDTEVEGIRDTVEDILREDRDFGHVILTNFELDLKIVRVVERADRYEVLTGVETPMEGYAATSILTPSEIALWERAKALVASVPEEWGVRCHELARAVGAALELPVVDGHYGIVEHSWCKVGRYRILDPYVPGSLPPVQLHDIGHALPHRRAYKPGESRDDIDTEMVDRLTALWDD